MPGDADFGWFGTLIGNAAKLGPTGGIVLMLVIGGVLLAAAVLFQKRVVDTGWDPGAARDAALPSEEPSRRSSPEPSGSDTAPPASRTYGKIAPPPCAPTPPPPPSPEAG